MKLLTTASSYQKYSEAHLQCETSGFFYFTTLVKFLYCYGFPLTIIRVE